MSELKSFSEVKEFIEGKFSDIKNIKSEIKDFLRNVNDEMILNKKNISFFINEHNELHWDYFEDLNK